MLNRRSFESIAGPVRAVLMLSPIAAVVVGSGAQASTPKMQPRALNTDSTQRVSATSATPLCTPLFGTGKAVGVPIAIKDFNGTAITDISSYTFELSDGSQTQDVTAHIKRPEQSQLVSGHNTVAPAPAERFIPFQNNYNLYSQNDSATGPALSFTNPGHYFLDCTPDASSSTIKFGSNIMLRMKSETAVVANVSLTGRGAVYHDMEYYRQFQANTITDLIKPAGSGNGDMVDMYNRYLTTVAVPFRRTFAIEAILEMSNVATNPGTNSTYCWGDLAITTGATWSLTQLGEDFVSELTNATPSSTKQILYDRTRGVSGAFTCLLSNLFNEDERFMNILAAQLLLIDGPLGNVPTAVSSQNDALRPASILQLTAPPTSPTVVPTTPPTTPIAQSPTTPPDVTTTFPAVTTTSTVAANASPTTTAKSVTTQSLPRTGSSSSTRATFALIALVSGAVIVQTRRRTSS